MAEDIAALMRERLQAALAPARLEVIDESAQHAGHAGWREGGQTHFRLRLSLPPALAGASRIARHRAVHRALGDLTTRVHALAIEFEDG